MYNFYHRHGDIGFVDELGSCSTTDDDVSPVPPENVRVSTALCT